MNILRRIGSTQIIVAVLGAAAAFGVVGAQAHHSFSAFDMDKLVTYKGTIVDFKLMNPHSHFTIQVAPGAADPKTVGTWDVEGGSLNIMIRQGWKKTTFKPGDPVTVVGHPMRDGAKGISLFYVLQPDGTRLYHDIARPKDEQ